MQNPQRGLDKIEAKMDLVSKVLDGDVLAAARLMRGLDDSLAEAVEALEEVSFRQVPGRWGIESYWTLYVALKRSGQASRADSLLKVLGDKPGELGERARQSLK